MPEEIEILEIGSERQYEFGGRQFQATAFRAKRLNDGTEVEAEVSRTAGNEKARPQVGQTLTGTLTESSYGIRFKRDYPGNPSGGGGGFQATPTATAIPAAAPKKDMPVQDAAAQLQSLAESFYAKALNATNGGDVDNGVLWTQANMMARQIFINSHTNVDLSGGDIPF